MRCETKRPARAIGRDCRACARNFCQEPSEVKISSTCKVGQKLGPFGVTIPATVPQGSEIPEGLMNNPVYIYIYIYMYVYIYTLDGSFVLKSNNHRVRNMVT